jgi:RNA polymerase sigma-70 factor (ECF subfamily)
MQADDDRRFVYSVARRIVRDDSTAHDVAQDTLLLAFRNRHQFRGDSSYRTWLYRIATTAALTALRRERMWRRSQDAVNEAWAIGSTPGAGAPPPAPDEALDQAARLAQADQVFASLDEKYRSVLELCVRDGKSELEAARVLGITRGTVKIRAFRARQMLRERLASM